MFTISLFDTRWREKTDEALIQASQQGDVRAFEVLYDRYHNALYAYLWNLLNYNYDDAVSLTSDVFIKFFEYSRTHQIDKVKTILYRIAHNAAIDWMRTNQTQREQVYLDEELEYIPAQDLSKEVLNTGFQKELLRQLCRGLDSHQREILYLYYYEDKSYEDIAEILHSNKNTIGNILARAKIKLQMLAEQYGVKDALQ